MKGEDDTGNTALQSEVAARISASQEGGKR